MSGGEECGDARFSRRRGAQRLRDREARGRAEPSARPRFTDGTLGAPSPAAPVHGCRGAEGGARWRRGQYIAQRYWCAKGGGDLGGRTADGRARAAGRSLRGNRGGGRIRSEERRVGE